MSNLIISRNENGNAAFHIGLNPDGALQPIINAVLPFSNMELMMQLLDQAEHSTTLMKAMATSSCTTTT